MGSWGDGQHCTQPAQNVLHQVISFRVALHRSQKQHNLWQGLDRQHRKWRLRRRSLFVPLIGVWSRQSIKCHSYRLLGEWSLNQHEMYTCRRQLALTITAAMASWCLQWCVPRPTLVRGRQHPWLRCFQRRERHRKAQAARGCTIYSILGHIQRHGSCSSGDDLFG